MGEPRLHISRDPSTFRITCNHGRGSKTTFVSFWTWKASSSTRPFTYENWAITLGTVNIGRHAFSIPIPYKTLNDKDKRTVDFVCRKIHGLTYQPCAPEMFQDPRVLGPLVKDIHAMYVTCSEGKRTVVGYKGGHVEKDLLQKLNIPSLNLETLGCPKYDVVTKSKWKP